MIGSYTHKEGNVRNFYRLGNPVHRRLGGQSPEPNPSISMPEMDGKSRHCKRCQMESKGGIPNRMTCKQPIALMAETASSYQIFYHQWDKNNSDFTSSS